MSAGRLRPSAPGDNAALLELFGAVPMEGDLVLSTRRDPDFFALYDVQGGIRECWVYENASGVSGLGTILVREGWLAGRPCRVGYLGDLRSSISASRERALVRVYGDALDGAARRHECGHFLTAVLASNAGALQALVRRSEARASQPVYRLLRRFAMVSIQFLPAWSAGGWRVRAATPEDVPAITERLDRDHRARPFGYRFDQGEFERRLARWPGMTLERTYLALDRGGRLKGVTSAWDPGALKRYRVVAYRGGMRWKRRALDAAAGLLGAPRLPEPGGDFRCLYLCNTSIEGDDPSILRALLGRIHAEHRRSGYHFFALCVYEGDPLARALRGFVTQRVDFHLYVVTPAGLPVADLPAGRPGFEMALA